jgi:23S rRNA (cytosine1962-C5)-methyltransferase
MPTQSMALIDAALAARAPLLDERHESAVRLFNGFVEGMPSLVIDLCGKTLVVHDYAEAEGGDEPLAREVTDHLAQVFPWLTCAVWKVRHSKVNETRNGTFLLGGVKQLTRKVKEAGVWYALAPTLNRDVGFYPDTRPLRSWAKANLAGKRVLNTFAYTGSLGVAARAAEAYVLHTDLSRRSLTLAKDSYSLNGWPIQKSDFRVGDFFEVVGQLKRDGQLFDCVFLDPPFFSITSKGKVDLQANAKQVLNGVRPLVADGGTLAYVNNAAFLSGAEHLASLEAMCADGYLAVEQILATPEDTAGYPFTRAGTPAVDPSPFNHSTKVVLLRVKRKDGRKATDAAASLDAAAAFSGQ